MLEHVLGQDYVRENAYTGELWEIPAAKWGKNSFDRGISSQLGQLTIAFSQI